MLLNFVLVYFCWIIIVVHVQRICIVLNMLRKPFLLASQRFRICWEIIFILIQFLLLFDFSKSLLTYLLRLKISTFIFFVFLEIVQDHRVLLVDWCACFSRLVLIALLLGRVDFWEEWYFSFSFILTMVRFDCEWLRVALIF